MSDWGAIHREAKMYKEMYPVGTRIRLEIMGDDPRPIPPGTRGTVKAVDDMGTVHCDFDNGRHLGLIPGEDSFRRLTEKELEQETIMPDITISVDEMKAYGYGWEGMLPMREDAAIKFWNRDICPVYRLYEDDTEGMIESDDVNEFREHAKIGGIFGVEKVDWLRVLENGLIDKDALNNEGSVLKFECNCRTGEDLATMLALVHKAKSGYNFEVGARLWYKACDIDKTIMVEYQIATQDCRDLTDNSDEPDWLTAYEVDDEFDDDVSHEIFTETIEDYITLSSLKDAMVDFAKAVFDRFYVEKSVVLEDKIQSAEKQSNEQNMIKSINSEIIR